MSPARFDLSIAHRLDEDRDFARLLVRLGPRTGFDADARYGGDDHYAPLDVVVDRPVRVHARLELTGAPDYLQAARFALGALDAGADAAAWLPVLDVGPEQTDRWLVSHRIGGWSGGGGRRLGYQGWWQHSPGVGRADVTTRVIAHSRHERGSLLWLGSRTNLETPGDEHKQVLCVVAHTDA